MFGKGEYMLKNMLRNIKEDGRVHVVLAHWRLYGAADLIGNETSLWLLVCVGWLIGWSVGLMVGQFVGWVGNYFLNGREVALSSSYLSTYDVVSGLGSPISIILQVSQLTCKNSYLFLEKHLIFFTFLTISLT